ncbi:translation initiation factor IF-2-like isoform X1 [Oxyura jamaicensis]|uniref:translation initiation factor IF-2-like isoform X1 n=1 Tax=Oxyura jamaicensis TaxID=8884 RepID=UPI0015A660E9|nr:translation initiation factor IF-2-like isoform X1 [Oxyura jamaicensis]
MSAAKPKRIKFSEEEKFLILEEFSLRKDILIPKSGRYKNTLDRQRAWEEIAAAVNSLSPLVQRTPDEIRKKWHNMVIDARKELAMEKHPLLRQRPQEKLFHNIFALFNKPSPQLPDPLLSGSSFRVTAAGVPAGPPAPLRAAGGMLEVAPDLLLHGQSGAAAPARRMLGTTGTPGPAPDGFLGAPGAEPDSKESLLPAGPQPSMEKRLLPPGMAAPRPASPQGTAPVLPPGSPEPPLIKCPLSPALAWPCLGVTASPAAQSGDSPGPPASQENGEAAPRHRPSPCWGRGAAATQPGRRRRSRAGCTRRSWSCRRRPCSCRRRRSCWRRRSSSWKSSNSAGSWAREGAAGTGAVRGSCPRGGNGDGDKLLVRRWAL